ncbi:MAG: ABC transporter ATP-binding protein [Deltaproteobacteria bacterium]|nr:ABC transporter ATP-binding protein [Deltaproteobacteria bacterium]
MAVVTVTNLRKYFGVIPAVDGISLEIQEGEFVTLLGPSGCGKTTTLRLIAGLEENDAGEIWIGGRIVSAPHNGVFVLPEKREIGMVFQSYAIWPHMTVFENVAFPLRIRHLGRAVIREKVEKVLTLTGIEDLASRLATQLSGGQQQRVAIARAFAVEPAVLLMDEPLSNLDAKLRDHMRFELRELQRRTGVTTIYVTHDQAESMVLSDRIVVMNKGRIEQVGAPQEIYESPRSKFVSDFVGLVNLIEVDVLDLSGEKCRLRAKNGREFLCEAARVSSEVRNGVALIRPENLKLGRDGVFGNNVNTFEGIVESATYFGDHRDYQIRDGDLILRSKTDTAVNFARGDRVTLYVHPRHILVLGEEK